MKTTNIFKLTLILLIVGIMLFGVFGCAKPAETPTETKDLAEGKGITANLVMGTGGVAGTWYPLGGAFCTQMSDGAGLNVTVQASGGGVENARTVASGERDLGMLGNNVAAYAYEGKLSFEGTPLSNLRGLYSFLPNQVQFVVRTNSGINCLADMKGKAVGVGAIGSGDELSIREELLGPLGITYDDFDEQMLSVAEQVTAFKDNHLDVIYLIASAPTSGVMDAAAQAKVTLVPIVGEEKATIMEKAPFYVETVITNKQYEFLEKDIETVATMTIMVTNAELDENIAYELVKNTFEGVTELQAFHPGMREFSLENALIGMSIPLHPGAERYYKEKGIID